MAFASIHIPDFLVQALVCVEPSFRISAVALLDGSPPLLEIVTANDAACRLGATVGMSQSQAEQISGVLLRDRCFAHEKAVHDALLEVGRSFSPRIEDTAQETIVIDLDGLDALFGSHENIANRCTELMYERGLSVNVAVAANVEAAISAARGFPGITIIPPGEELLSLGPLAVSILSPSTEALCTLQSWGIHTFAALAALPAPELSERLGQEGIRLRERAQGNCQRQLVLAESNLFFEETFELEDPVAELEPLSFLLSRLLSQLSVRLQAHALAFYAIRLRLQLTLDSENPFSISSDSLRSKEDLNIHETYLQLPTPMRDCQTLLNLLRLQLQANPPSAAVHDIAMMAVPAAFRSTQNDLFLSSFPAPEKLELTIVRLANLVGNLNVGSPELIDSHQTEAFQMRPFRPPREINHKPSRTPTNDGIAPIMTLRIFRPAVPARVQLRNGQPTSIFFDGLQGDVLVASGPWRNSGHWWANDYWNQDEWDLEIHFCAGSKQKQSGLYRLYCDLIKQKWFVKGAYD